MRQRHWRIGELARAVGLTVRTLRYYDAVGLVQPSRRTPAGHRLYSAADVRRLYQVLALRQLGFGLQQIRTTLDADAIGLEAVVGRQLASVERQIQIQIGLRARLQLALTALQQAEQPSAEVLIGAMERMTMLERYLTPEQLARIREHHERLGATALERFRAARQELLAQFEAARQAGVDPSSPEVVQLRQRFGALVLQALSDDQEVMQSLRRMIETEGIERASEGAIQPALQAYLEGRNTSTSNPG